MSVTLNATPKDPAANANATLAEVSDYLLNRRMHAAAWAGVAVDDQNRCIIMATSLLDYGMQWNGSIRTMTQALRWPRSGIRDEDGRWGPYDTIPDLVKYATAELAFHLSQRDRLAEPEVLGLGMSSVNLKGIQMSVDAKQILSMIPDFVILMLAALGSPAVGSVSGMRQIGLERT